MCYDQLMRHPVFELVHTVIMMVLTARTET